MPSSPPFDAKSAFAFTLPTQRDRALHGLSALLERMPTHHTVNLAEHRELEQWLQEHAALAARDAALADLMAHLRSAVADGLLTPDEIVDLCNWCDRLDPRSRYYIPLLRCVRRLRPVLAALPTNEPLLPRQCADLEQWLTEMHPFRRYWPMAEIEEALVATLEEGQLGSEWLEGLQRFLACLDDVAATLRIGAEISGAELQVEAVCARGPEIQFSGRTFCFTGRRKNLAREELVDFIRHRGGRIIPQVRGNLDFLVVCDCGADFWAFAWYGRRIERALEYRSAGAPVAIIREEDLRSAVRR